MHFKSEQMVTLHNRLITVKAIVYLLLLTLRFAEELYYDTLINHLYVKEPQHSQRSS